MNNEKCNLYSIIQTIEKPFKFRTIIYFEVGVIFTVFLTIEKEAFIFKTCGLINPKDKKQLNY